MKSLGRSLLVLVAVLGVAQKSPGHRIKNYPRWTNLFPLSILRYPFLPQRNTIMNAIERNGFFTLAAMLERSGLAFSLSGGGSGTLFAPTNRAFAALSPRTLTELHTNHAFLKKVLLGHLVSRTLYSKMLSNDMKVNSLAKNPLTFKINYRGASVNGANIVRADIRASKGVIHAIDQVLLPSQEPPESMLDVAEANGFSTLIAYAQIAGLSSILDNDGPITLFAPTNEAFAALPSKTQNDLRTDPRLLKTILLGHIAPKKLYSSSLSNNLEVESLSGNPLKFQGDFRRRKSVNGANIVKKDVEASNGVIHAIDKVLLPESETQNSIVDVAVANGFSSFATYVQNAGLGSTLSEDGPFTVFAPTDEAFSALPFSTLNELQTNPDRFKDVLLSHVARSRVYFDELFNNLEIGSLSGNPLKFQVDFFGSSVNGANIIQRDIEASNGVIHAIDQVIFPEEGGSTPGSSLDVAVDNGYTTFVTYVQNAGLTAALEGDDISTIFVPTNAAFENLPRTTIDDLLRDSEYLRQVLLSHVTRGRIFSNNLTNNLVATSISGNPLTFRVFGRTILVNGATVVKPDVETASGSVIHAIDRVIIPISRNSGREIIFRN